MITPLSVAMDESMYTPRPIAGYDNEFGFYQIGLDLVREDMEMFNAFANHDYKEMKCMNEAELAALNEGSIKEFFTKIIEAIKKFLDRLWQAIKRFLAQFQAKIDIWGKKAKFFEDHVLPKWKDSNETVKIAYLDGSDLGSEFSDLSKSIDGALTSIVDCLVSICEKEGELDVEEAKKNVDTNVWKYLNVDNESEAKKILEDAIITAEEVSKTKANAQDLVEILKNGKNNVNTINDAFHTIDGVYSKCISKLKNATIKNKNGAEAVSVFSTELNKMMQDTNHAFTIILNYTVRGLNFTSIGLSALAKGVTKGSGNSDKKEKEESKPEA